MAIGTACQSLYMCQSRKSACVPIKSYSESKGNLGKFLTLSEMVMNSMNHYVPKEVGRSHKENRKHQRPSYFKRTVMEAEVYYPTRAWGGTASVHSAAGLSRLLRPRIEPARSCAASVEAGKPVGPSVACAGIHIWHNHIQVAPEAEQFRVHRSTVGNGN